MHIHTAYVVFLRMGETNAMHMGVFPRTPHVWRRDLEVLTLIKVPLRRETSRCTHGCKAAKKNDMCEVYIGEKKNIYIYIYVI